MMPIGLTISCACLERAKRLSRDETLDPSVHHELMTGRHPSHLAEWLTSDASVSRWKPSGFACDDTCKEPHGVHLPTVPLDFSSTSPCPIALRGLTVPLDTPLGGLGPLAHHPLGHGMSSSI